MKNNTSFPDSVVKKYGVKICRVASQYGVMPAEVKRDPENYWIFPNGKPMSMKTRRKILKRDWEKKRNNRAYVKTFPSPRRIFVKKSKKKNCVDIYELGEPVGITISGGEGTIKMAAGGITSFPVNTCGDNGIPETITPLSKLSKRVLKEAESGKTDAVLNILRHQGVSLPGSVKVSGVNGYFKKKQNAESLEKTIKNQAVKVLNLKTEGIRLPGERPPMEIRDVEDEKPINSEIFFFMVGLAIGAILTFILCTWRA